MNYLGLLEGKQWIAISEDFDYVRATKDFVGLKLFPMVRTENMKLAVADLVEGADVPVMALVHALDTEARIGDRPDFQEIEYELLLVKEKLNQGEALRKKLKDLGMSNEEKTIMNAVFNDAANLISRVITRFEVAACEALATAKMTVNENNAKVTTMLDVQTNEVVTDDTIHKIVNAVKTAADEEVPNLAGFHTDVDPADLA